LLPDDIAIFVQQHRPGRLFLQHGEGGIICNPFFILHHNVVREVADGKRGIRPAHTACKDDCNEQGEVNGQK